MFRGIALLPSLEWQKGQSQLKEVHIVDYNVNVGSDLGEFGRANPKYSCSRTGMNMMFSKSVSTECPAYGKQVMFKSWLLGFIAAENVPSPSREYNRRTRRLAVCPD